MVEVGDVVGDVVVDEEDGFGAVGAALAEVGCDALHGVGAEGVAVHVGDGAKLADEDNKDFDTSNFEL